MAESLWSAAARQGGECGWGEGEEWVVWYSRHLEEMFWFLGKFTFVLHEPVLSSAPRITTDWTMGTTQHPQPQVSLGSTQQPYQSCCPQVHQNPLSSSRVRIIHKLRGPQPEAEVLAWSKGKMRKGHPLSAGWGCRTGLCSVFAGCVRIGSPPTPPSPPCQPLWVPAVDGNKLRTVQGNQVCIWAAQGNRGASGLLSAEALDWDLPWQGLTRWHSWRDMIILKEARIWSPLCCTVRKAPAMTFSLLIWETTFPL